MKKYSLLSALALLGMLAGCGCCEKKSCQPETCEEQIQECKTCPPCDNEWYEVKEVASVTPQQERVSGPLADTTVKWNKEDYA